MPLRKFVLFKGYFADATWSVCTYFLYHMIAVSTYETTLEEKQKVSEISVRKSEKSGEFD